MRYQLRIFQLILVVFLTSCASGNNRYFNNKNTLGLLGGAGGAAGGYLLYRSTTETRMVSVVPKPNEMRFGQIEIHSQLGLVSLNIPDLK